ncbi:hypothetical protein ABIG06_006839 [Bradyrhizobium sp. USDA 326]|uniref:hypothetical protein n=1 Tax=unclassified Bradyrhizobium TaxID=2631580 RepID=UPI003515E854
MGFGMWLVNLLVNAATNFATSDNILPALTLSMLAAGIFGIVRQSGRVSWGERGVDSWWFIGLWAVVGIVAIGAMAFGLGLRAAKPKQPDTQTEEPTNKQQSASYLKDVHFYGGSLSPPVLNPRFEARFVRAGKRCRLFIDHRYYARGIGRGEWTSRPLIELPRIEEFVEGQSLTVAVLTPFEIDGRIQWRWGPAAEQTDAKTTFVARSWHRGRIIVRCDDAPPQSYYFIIDPEQSDAAPMLIGLDRFDFIKEWEAEDKRQN